MHKALLLFCGICSLIAYIINAKDITEISIGMFKHNLIIHLINIFNNKFLGADKLLNLSSEQLMRQQQILNLLAKINEPFKDEKLKVSCDLLVMDSSKYFEVF